MLDLSGRTFGRLQVKDKAGRVKNNMTWNCVCVCGGEKVVAAVRLTSSNVRSCGCLIRMGTAKTHGFSGSKEYAVWQNIKKRCQNPRTKTYPRYGGRGIRLCPQWQTFAGFLADMGRRPSPNQTVERIDNNGNYEPGNCRWATQLEQANNKRTNHIIDYRGERMSIANAVRSAGSLVSRDTASNRITRGWDVIRAVETPNSFRRDPETRRVIQTLKAE